MKRISRTNLAFYLYKICLSLCLNSAQKQEETQKANKHSLTTDLTFRTKGTKHKLITVRVDLAQSLQLLKIKPMKSLNMRYLFLREDKINSASANSIYVFSICSYRHARDSCTSRNNVRDFAPYRGIFYSC